jgi:hypothetical protein
MHRPTPPIAPTAPPGEGFGVGHTRDTQTKGVWLWGQGQSGPDEAGVNRTVVFVDTEGFESTARSSSYDDRIFAVAAVLSSLLIYVSGLVVGAAPVCRCFFVSTMLSVAIRPIHPLCLLPSSPARPSLALVARPPEPPRDDPRVRRLQAVVRGRPGVGVLRPVEGQRGGATAAGAHAVGHTEVGLGGRGARLVVWEEAVAPDCCI